LQHSHYTQGAGSLGPRKRASAAAATRAGRRGRSAADGGRSSDDSGKSVTAAV